MIRPRLTDAEYRIIQEVRKGGGATELLKACDEGGVPLSDVRHYWYKNKKFSIFAKNEGAGLPDLFEPILAELQGYSPKFERIPREHTEDPHCLVIDPADIHVGKYAAVSETGQAYDIDKAVTQIDWAIDGILRKASGFNLDKIVFVIGNDVLHTDTPRRTTTSGTPQDTSGMWHEAFLAAKSMYVRAIEKMLPYADIRVIYNPSNHDYMSGFMLAQTIEAYYRQHPNVTFDNSIAHRKYFRYGNNLIATSHGDGAKLNDTPLLMASEQPLMWSECHYRYIYLHHVHHKQTHKFMSGKDFIGVTAEYVRSPSPSDSWHDRNGYVGAKKAVEAFVHSFAHGQVARLTHHV
jgi:hypothetical protein